MSTVHIKKDGGKDREGVAMKSKLLIVGLVTLMLVIGLAMISCRAGCEGAGNCKLEVTKSGLDYDVKGSACTDRDCGVQKMDGEGTFKCDC